MSGVRIQLNAEGNAVQVINATANAQRDLNKAISDADKILSSGTVRGSGQSTRQFIAGFPPHIQKQILSQLGASSSTPPPIPNTPSASPQSGGFGGLIPPRVNKLLGALGGGEGGAAGAIVPVLGALAAFRVALWAVEPALRALRFGIEEILKSIREGSKLYTDSAKLGLNPGRVANLQFAANSLGISTEEAQNMMLQAEFPRHRSSGGSVTRNSTSSFHGSIIEAGGQQFGSNGRIKQLGEQQKLNNLQYDFNRLMKESADPSNRLGENAKVLQRTQEILNEASLEWKATISDIATALAPVAVIMADIVKYSLKIWENFSQAGIIIKALGIINKYVAGPTDFKQSPPLSNNSLNPNSFQRMGFNFNGGFNGRNDYARVTAKATQDTVTILQQLTAVLAGGLPAGNSQLSGMAP